MRGLLDASIESGGVPALAAAAFTGDRILAADARGIRRRGASDAVTVRDRFHVGSLTKSMTATLAAVLVEDDRIAWSDTVGEILGSRLREMNPAYEDATLALLLRHRAGVPGEVPADLWAEVWEARRGAERTRLRFVDGMLQLDPVGALGEKYVYSNAGYVAAGMMLERAGGGAAWEKLITERLFRPLGMRSAGFGAPAADGRRSEPWGHAPDPVPPEPRGDNPPAMGPAGTVHCSITDLARFAMCHLRAGRESLDPDELPALLEPESFALLHAAEPGEDYAYGWAVTRRPWSDGPVLNHTGSNTMFFAVLWLSPGSNFGVAIACNEGGQRAEAACDGVAGELIREFLPKTKDAGTDRSSKASSEPR